MRLPLALAATILAGTAFAGQDALAAPAVVTTIQPIHSLAAGVMAGIGEPVLLVPPGNSPHSFQMKPSQAAALQAADVVFWVGEPLEAFLEKPLASLRPETRVVELIEAPGVRLLQPREGGAWEPHVHEGEDDHDHGHGHEEVDAHIWLGPDNARAIALAMAETLAGADAANAGHYRANAQALVARIDALEGELRQELAPVQAKPFIVLHDAYAYFEQAFDLTAVGSITVSPERPPGAQRLAELRAKIERQDATCVFAEPQASPELVATLVEGTGAGTGTLDPEGSSAIPTGPDAWFALMRGNARELVTCLSRSS
ncbi:MAG: zinc ABC transporter substrate-binding protein [Geminicoccaceae bacterium]